MTHEELKTYKAAWWALNKGRYRGRSDTRVRAGRKYNRTKRFVCAKAARRNAAKMQRVPAWANRQKIAEMYATCPPGFHVDHVIPLRGETVSGLHVHENLQHLPARENARKSNHFAGG